MPISRANAPAVPEGKQESAAGSVRGAPLAYASVSDADPELVERIAWWIGLAWSVGVLLERVRAAWWALIDLLAWPQMAGNVPLRVFSHVQTLLLVTAATVLAAGLVAWRRGWLPRRWLVVAAVMAGLAACAEGLLLLDGLQRGSWDSNRLAWEGARVAGRVAGVLALLWVLLMGTLPAGRKERKPIGGHGGPFQPTARGLAILAGAALLLVPARHAVRTVDTLLDPFQRGFTRILAPYYLFEHGQAAVHLAGALLVLLALRRQPPSRPLLRAAAIAIPLGVLVGEVAPRVLIWENLSAVEAITITGRALAQWSPCVALLLWPVNGLRRSRLLRCDTA